MKFDLTLVPDGVTAKALRGFLRRYRFVGQKAADLPDYDPPERISRAEVSEWFGRDLTAELVEKGLLEQTSRSQYRVTELGNRLAPQSLGGRINRAKADKIVADFLARVAAANADPDAVRYVCEVIAFGSFIGDTDDLGDIDLLVLTAPRDISEQEWRRRLRSRYAGRYPKLDAYRDLKMRLRNRNRFLSFHPKHDLRDCDERKVIFSAPIEGTPEPHAIWDMH